MKELFSTYKLPIIFGVLGLILAVLWIAVGFFKTLLIDHGSDRRRYRFLSENKRKS